MLAITAKDLIAVCGSARPADIGQTEVLEAVSFGAHLSHGTRYGKRSCFKRLLTFLHEEHGAPDLAKHVPRIVPPAPRAVTITHGEKAAILSRCPTWLRCWVLLCSDLALRNATAYSISPDHYDAEAGTVTFRTKFGSWQTLPVTAELAGMFASARKDRPSSTPFVVLLHPLGRVNREYPHQKLRVIVKALGYSKHITAHDLRRTTAKAVYEQSHDVRLVQAVLGHKQLATTLYYLDHRATPVPVSTLELAKLPPVTERPQ